ncbi:MAG: hypothetical protein AMXMBFR84_47310 [Candidatus Hydrogenedentota bacterium]
MVVAVLMGTLVLLFPVSSFAAEAGDASVAPAAETPAPDSAEAEPTEPQAEAAAAEPPTSDAVPADSESPASPSDPQDSGENSDTEMANTKWISGQIDLQGEAEWSDAGEDYDFDQFIRINIDPPQNEKIHIRSSFWLYEDISPDDDRAYYLNDLSDTWDSDFQARVLTLHVDVEDLWGDSLLRIGRQRIFEGQYFGRMDGIYFKKSMPKWDWYAFAGWRASLYEDAFDDPVLGGGLSWQPTTKTRIALDAYYASEELDHKPRFRRRRFSEILYHDYPREWDDSFSDTMVALSIWQDITTNLRVFGRYSWYDKGSDELLLELVGYVPNWDLSYEVSYRRMMDETTQRVDDQSSYYRVLGTYEDYDSWFMALHKPISKRIALSVEGELRDVRGDEFATNNPDYLRYAAILSLSDLPWGLSGNLAYERWDVDGRDDAWMVSGELTKTWVHFALTVGASYERWVDEYEAYDFFPQFKNQVRSALNFGGYQTPYYANNFTVNLRDKVPVIVRDDIYALFAECVWTINPQNEVKLGVSYEIDDYADSPYWQVSAGYSLKF